MTVVYNDLKMTISSKLLSETEFLKKSSKGCLRILFSSGQGSLPQRLVGCDESSGDGPRPTSYSAGPWLISAQKMHF